MEKFRKIERGISWNLQMNVDPVGKVYGAVGSEEPFYRLVELFYKGVESDPVLRPMYPEDLTDAKRKLSLFLIQRTGGAGTYSEERGHPRMRGRHMPFRITTLERNAWMHYMMSALDAVPEFTPHRDTMHEFFSEFSTFMINTEG
jgi:hemoglobin